MNNENKLNPSIVWRANELMDAFKINATYHKSIKVGSCTPSGVYDGVLGDLQRNASDFSINFLSVESIMDPNCASPVIFDKLFDQQNNHISSAPIINETLTVKSVHEAFLVFDSSVTLLMIGVYFLSLYLLSKSASVNRCRPNLWMLNRIWLHQDTDDDKVGPSSQRAVLNSTKLFIFHFIILVCACMNTDLITHTKPTLIDTVRDAINSKIRISVPQISRRLYSSESSPRGLGTTHAV